ncbi:MAG: hypothetical protein LAP21_27300 [Acidobacteriia bacterium]|nr:hypothetical protein [Terriglobia bacterium]
MTLSRSTFLIAMLFLGLWSRTTPATPRWEVWVVDENGHTLKGMTVRLSWRNYSAEKQGHEEDRITDKNGYVVFPARTLKASRSRRAAETADSARAGVHASFGPHASVYAFGQGREGYATTDGPNGQYITDWTGSPPEMQSHIVANVRTNE